MRRMTMLALVAVLALVGAACGGDDDDSGGPEPASDDGGTTDDGATTDDGGDDGGGTGGVAGAGLVDEDCQFLLAGALANPLATVVPGTTTDYAGAADRFDAIADAAPDEIEEAMATLAEAQAELAEAISDFDLSNVQTYQDPDFLAAFQGLADVFDDDYQEAAAEVQSYVATECKPAG